MYTLIQGMKLSVVGLISSYVMVVNFNKTISLASFVCDFVFL